MLINAAWLMVLQLSTLSGECLITRYDSCSYPARPNFPVDSSSHAQVVALSEPEAQCLLEELATGKLAIGSYHELHALFDKVNSQLGLLLSDIWVASGHVVVC